MRVSNQQSLMDGELWLETPCEHGEMGRIHNTDGEYSGGVMCPGGSRRRVEIDYEAAVRRGIQVTGDIDGISMGDWRSIVDAALGVGS